MTAKATAVENYRGALLTRQRHQLTGKKRENFSEGKAPTNCHHKIQRERFPSLLQRIKYTSLILEVCPLGPSE